MATETDLGDAADAAPPPARDLFELEPPPRVPTPAPTRPRRREWKSSRISLPRLALLALSLAAASVALGLPVWIVAILPCAAVAGELLAPWRQFRRAYWVAICAALCAQATSSFVTPFTWPMRFGFVSVLVGFGVVAYAAQTDGLA